MQAITTPRAPGAVGPYSQAVLKNDMLFISGQLGMDPVTNILPHDFHEQAEQVFNNLKTILDAAGMACSHVVKVTIYVTDLSNFSTLNDIYANHFCAPYPARETVQVARLPREAKVEISLIAIK
jgi:2-iminobutanoate/2-iminopropanoate deaminase